MRCVQKGYRTCTYEFADWADECAVRWYLLVEVQVWTGNERKLKVRFETMTQKFRL